MNLTDKNSETRTADEASKKIVLETAYFGRYVTKPGGPFAEGGLGYLAKSPGFPENAAEIDDWVRGSDKKIIFDSGREEEGMIFCLFGESGFWGVQIGSRKDPSGKGRAATIARIWLLPDVQNWLELPFGIFSFLANPGPLEPLVEGAPTEEKPILLQDKNLAKRSHLYFKDWENKPPHYKRLGSAVWLLSVSSAKNTSRALALPMKMYEAESYQHQTEFVGLELDLLGKNFPKEIEGFLGPFSINGLFKGSEEYLSYSTAVENLPESEISPSQNRCIQELNKNAFGVNRYILTEKLHSISKNGIKRIIGKEPIILPDFGSSNT